MRELGENKIAAVSGGDDADAAARSTLALVPSQLGWVELIGLGGVGSIAPGALGVGLGFACSAFKPIE